MKQKLQIRYERNAMKDNNSGEKMEIDGQIDRTETHIPNDITLTLPETPTDDPLYGNSDDFISCDQLYQQLQKSQYLIIDIRHKADYDKSKIKSKRIINIPPSEIRKG